MATSSPRRPCLNHPNVFCYICGEYTLQSNRKGVNEFVKCTYLAHFKVMLSDQNKAWAPYILYASNVLSIFDSGQKRIESHSALVFQWSGVNRRYDVVVRASASQSVDLEFIPLVESCQQTLKNGIYSFPAWCSAFMGGCGRQPEISLILSLGKALNGSPTFMWKTGAPDTSEKATPKRVRTYRPKT